MPAAPHLRACIGLAALLLAGCLSRSPVAPTAASPAPATAPRDAFVLLSGGGTPTSNNYSQYLQARALAAFLQQRYSRDAIWIFFGAGNRDGEPPLLGDVYRQIKHDGLLLDTWLPGSLPHNRAATKENFLRTLRTEILPRVRSGGTLYLLVGDHGELTSGKNPESAITMWGLRRDSANPRGWATARDYALTVTELRSALAAGLGSGRVVFVMTQCHSGGFHELGTTREVHPPRTWFTSPPAWLASTAQRFPSVAGFTATDEESIAAGCDPFPDPETWLGYERFFPEQLVGHDLMVETSTRRAPALSFFSAHEAATLVDQTLDKPRATSEHYLERWANLIETKLAHELLLTPAARVALDAYARAVETGQLAASPADPAFRAAQSRLSTRLERMAAQQPATRRLLLHGTRAELEKSPALRTARAPRSDAEPESAGNLSRAQAQLWRDVLRPAWHKAVTAGEIPELTGPLVAFERRLHSLDTRRPPGFADSWSNRALTELYWSSGYATASAGDSAAALALSRWAATRRAAILAWATRSSDPAIRDAAAQFGPEFHRPRTPPPPPRDTAISAATAAARALYYRRILAAWSFLLTLDHRPALAELTTLQCLEQTPLPPPTQIRD